MEIGIDGVYTDSKCGSPYEVIRYPATNRNQLRSNKGNRPRTSLAFGSKPDGSIEALLQFIHGAGTAALGWCLPAAQFWTAVNLVSMVSINLRIWFYGVEQGDAGESIEREERQ